VKRHYYLLGQRERLAVHVSAVVLVLALIVLAGILPAQKKLAVARDQQVAAQELNAWIKANEARLRDVARVGGGSAAMTGQALLTQVNRSAQMAGVTLRRTEPEGDDKLRVWLEEASFNGVIAWLAQLDQQMNIKVINISVESHRDPGLANVRIILGASS
jgi:general secretion pathway protein M